jgi:hypothetical protein
MPQLVYIGTPDSNGISSLINNDGTSNIFDTNVSQLLDETTAFFPSLTNQETTYPERMRCCFLYYQTV